MRSTWTAVLATLLSSRAAFAQSKLPPLPAPPGEVTSSPPPSSGVEYAPAPSSDIVYSPGPPPPPPPLDPSVAAPPPYQPTVAASPDDDGPPWARGFYLRMGAGVNTVVLQRTTSLGDTTTTSFGFATDIAVGGTVLSGLSLAATVNVGQAYLRNFGNPDEQVVLVGVGGMVDWHPSPTLGWHVGGAIALASIIVDSNTSSDTLTTPAGVTVSTTQTRRSASNTDAQLSVLGGYDWRLSRRWSVGVQARISYWTAAPLSAVFDDDGPRAKATAFALEGSILF
ncbi:MAG TPA: hypothetical protein VH044_01475 [Polyangiaceae bacterium]|jgi:hypothetical protein|nr:hypothetical protein [Polyangiaceae bacterium]